MKRWAAFILLAIFGMVAWLLLITQNGVRVRPHPSLPAFVLDLSDDATTFQVGFGEDENGDGLPDLLLAHRRKVGINLRRSLRALKIRPKYRADSAYWIQTDDGRVVRQVQVAESLNLNIRMGSEGDNQVVQTEREKPALAIGAVTTIWDPKVAAYQGHGKKYYLGSAGHHFEYVIALYELGTMNAVYETQLGSSGTWHDSKKLREQGRLLISTPDEVLPVWSFTEYRLTTMSETVYELESSALGLPTSTSGSWEFLGLSSRPDEVLRVLLLVEVSSGMRIVEVDFASFPASSRLLWEIPGVRSLSLLNQIGLEQMAAGPWLAVATIEPSGTRAPGVIPELKLRVRPPSGKPHLTLISLDAFKSDPFADWSVFDVHQEAVADQDGDGVTDYIVLVECMGARDLAVWFLCSGATGELIPQKAQPERTHG
jgi:hypothetical protein